MGTVFALLKLPGSRFFLPALCSSVGLIILFGIGLINSQQTRMPQIGDIPSLVRVEAHRNIGDSVPVEYVGVITFPKKVYVDDSCGLWVKLKPSLLPTSSDPSISAIDSTSGKSISLTIERESDVQQAMEVELFAAGIKVDGEKEQRRDLSNLRLEYYWNCFFPDSGDHEIALAFRLFSDSGCHELGTVTHRVKVVKVASLTQRQVWMLASFAGMISGGLAVVEVLHRLGVW